MTLSALTGRSALLVLLGSVPMGLSGCGAAPSTPSCTVQYPLRVSPLAGTADHAAAPPGNQVHFIGGAVATAPAGCPVPALALAEWATWQNPDPDDITISSAADMTNGVAVCKAATQGAVTLTGTFSPEALDQAPGAGTNATTATVTLVCK